MFQPDVPQRPLAELDASGQSNIKAFGSVHKRDVNGLLPLAARSILQPVAKKHTPAVARPAQKAPQIEAKAAAARGVGQWITVTLIIGELKGDEGRTARDRAMLLGDVAEPASYVKVVLGFERKGKAWIEKMLAGETDPAEGALAKRGADGKTKYIKLSAEEKQTAVQIYDSVLEQGYSARRALQHMQTSVLRFANVSASSVSAWRKSEQTAGDNNSADLVATASGKAAHRGAPAVVPQEVRDEVKRKVRTCLGLSCMLALVHHILLSLRSAHAT